MTDHVALAIEEIDQTIARLTDVRDKLRWFRQEFPHTAAAMVPVVETADRAGAVRAAAGVTVTPPLRSRDHASAGATLDDLDARILQTIAALGGVRLKAGPLLKKLKISRPALARHVKALVDAGRLEKHGQRMSLPGRAKEGL